MDRTLIGHLTERTGYSSTLFVAERTDIGVGEYVVVGDSLFGVISSLERVRPAFGVQVDLSRDVVEGHILFLGVLETREGRLRRVKTPPQPGAPVWRATVEDLAVAYASPGEKGQLILGHLLGYEEMPVGVSAQALTTRHMAILASTGAGKSNTVGVLLEELAKLDATAVVMDMHGEYADPETKKAVAGGKRIVPFLVIEDLARERSPEAVAEIVGIPRNATRQMELFKKAWETVAPRDRIDPSLKNKEEFWKRLEAVIIQEGRGETERVEGLLARTRMFFSLYKDALKLKGDSVLSQVEPGRVNVLDMSALPDETLDLVASDFLHRLFFKRRYAAKGGGDTDSETRAVMGPVVVFMEEAHLLVPSDRDTFSSALPIVKRIAREGRKFGIGLVLVSQRPRNVNADVLSQTNTKIILRLADPSDAEYVRKASEGFTEDFARQVITLDVGEALVFGMGIKTPALVQVRRCASKMGGVDIDVVEEWQRAKKKLSRHSIAAVDLGLVSLEELREEEEGKDEPKPPSEASDSTPGGEEKEGDDTQVGQRRKRRSEPKSWRPAIGRLPIYDD